ncbi:CD209 antigen-like protein C [Notolabrus celidotus]|uniref:CD209 antigen-like protein C n=1 Tax=Notolabrus celidotus TaxID=1203425 RepID=UPI00149071F6|nr:CD209 antigen-like protein C [Notolabrus celidotus]
MAVLFHSSESYINVEVGEYQEFSRPEPEVSSTERNTKPKFRHFSVVLLSFGLLCVLQGVLNISLRLALSQPCPKVEIVEHTCPKGWLMFASSCYYISSQQRNWDNSRKDCLQRDADLVIINSRQEQAFLMGFTMAAWVGMTDREEEGTWVWVDGTRVQKKKLQWALGQPDGAFGGEDCGDLRTMIDFIGLNDFNCSARSQWICEKKFQ